MYCSQNACCLDDPAKDDSRSSSNQEGSPAHYWKQINLSNLRTHLYVALRYKVFARLLKLTTHWVIVKIVTIWLSEILFLHHSFCESVKAVVLCCSHCKNKVICCSSLKSSFRIGSLHSYITMGVYKDNNGFLFINTGIPFMCQTITSCTPPIANEDQNWKLLPKIGDIPRGNFLGVLFNNKQNATTEQWKTVCRKIFSLF